MTRIKTVLLVILLISVDLAIITAFVEHIPIRNDKKFKAAEAEKIKSLSSQQALDALQAASSMYLPSLEERENSEFLLTPAILIQQSISATQIIIYPQD